MYYPYASEFMIWNKKRNREKLVRILKGTEVLIITEDLSCLTQKSTDLLENKPKQTVTRPPWAESYQELMYGSQ